MKWRSYLYEYIMSFLDDNNKTTMVTKNSRSLYERNVQNRSTLHYLLGLLVRWKQNFKYVKACRIARHNGATIGKGVIMPLSLAKRANKNLLIGDHVSIQTDKIDL